MNHDSLAVLEFAEAIMHGDDDHCAWLRKAAKAFIAGEPPPPVAGSGNIDRITAERDGLEDALHKIESWGRAYPLTVFPEPDLKKVRELLAAGGITLDAVSASCMRHVVEGVGKIARGALAALTPAVSESTIDNTPSCGMENDYRRATVPDTDGKPARIDRWPRKGDRMTFLGKNGYDHERQAALKVFEVGNEYEVDACSVESFSHSVSFVGISNRWNGVMFKITSPVPDADGKTGS